LSITYHCGFIIFPLTSFLNDQCYFVYYTTFVYCTISTNMVDWPDTESYI
jgi:hypothetical protein